MSLVLTDVTMPGMNGKEMVKRIDQEKLPDLKVLYMSGYSEIRARPRPARETVHLCGLLARVRSALARSAA